MGKTFKETDEHSDVDKKIKKAGLSLAIIFSKDDIKRFDLKYGDVIRLSDAEIIKQDK